MTEPRTTRRGLLATLGGAMGASVLARAGVGRLETAGRGLSAGPASDDGAAGGASDDRTPVDPASLRLDTPGRELLADVGTPHAGLGTPDRWEALVGDCSPALGPDAGDGALRVDPDPTARVEYAFDEPFDFSRRDLSFWTRFPTGPANPIRVRLFAPDEANQILAYNYPLNRWPDARFGVEVGPTSELGSPDPTDVRRMQIEVDRGDRGDRSHRPAVFDGFATKPKASTGRVMVIFDDNRASVADAFAEMDARGMPAATAVIPDAVGLPGHLDAEQLADHHAAGWDMVAHPQLEYGLPHYSRERQHEAIRETKRWLVERGYEAGADHIVTPLGRASTETLDLIARYHYTNYLTNDVLSGTPPVDPLTIERVAIDDVDAATAAVGRAERYGMTAVLMAHTVGVDSDDLVSFEGFVDVLDRIERADVELTTPTEFWERSLDRV
ncbi:polysaccharide deacetylase family protein [Candidatus Halobonum tyrrellensis]|uniref:Polysaccharide deacetylase n=1 Tax=Candidatus Halobonum tyrrellensis G22 TaxID=1324957 RepID=V4GQN8_9EURY|nr:polysaccharide deacetylase [Candidatus Halobonum tyrrellensis]ESP87346.1 polysaccharide deacetylase [Candidatus Halobonum tyrrellensis G22]